MKKASMFILASALVMLMVVPPANAGMFGGSNGKVAGFFYSHSWMRDDDGDGIPNGMDDDWVSPMDGTGFGFKYGYGEGQCDADSYGQKIMEKIGYLGEKCMNRQGSMFSYFFRYRLNGQNEDE